MCGAKCGWRLTCCCKFHFRSYIINPTYAHSLSSPTCSCTASILNLCAISLDRYVAVTRPVSYPSIMSTRRAKSLIAGLWVLSFVICFPPLIGWRNEDPVSILHFGLSWWRNFNTSETIHSKFSTFSTSISSTFSTKFKVKKHQVSLKFKRVSQMRIEKRSSKVYSTMRAIHVKKRLTTQQK